MARERLRRLIALLGALGTITFGPTVHAFCRATTCDPAARSCTTDSHHCLTEGTPLAWPPGTISVWVDPAGSKLRGIDAAQTARALAKAFSQWSSAPCGDAGRAAVDVTVLSGTAHPPPEAQVMVSFRDDSWPYDPSFGALTRLAFDADTGALAAAKTEINSVGHALSVDPSGGGVDFDAVITHEAGHLLGLAHSDVPLATMEPEARGFGSIDLASLAPDDQAGICAVYPPGANDEESVLPPSCEASGRSLRSRRGGGALLSLSAIALGSIRRKIRGR